MIVHRCRKKSLYRGLCICVQQLVSFLFLYFSAIFCLIKRCQFFFYTVWFAPLTYMSIPGHISLFAFFRWLERDFLKKNSYYRKSKHKQFPSLYVWNRIFRNASNSKMQECFWTAWQLERIVITASNNLWCDLAVLWTDTVNDQFRTHIN